MAVEDSTLVEEVLRGNRSAYAELYDRYAPVVRAICYDATRDLSQAQDLSQDVFLRAYSRLGQLRDHSRFAAWLVGIARMACREWRRRQMRDRHKYVGLSPAEPTADGQPSDDGRLDGLRRAMAALPERERLALHVFYLQGQSADAVRQILGLSSSGAYRLLDRARQRLHNLLADKQENER